MRPSIRAVARRWGGTRVVWVCWAATRGLFVAILAVIARLHADALPTDVAVVYYRAARAIAGGAAPYLDFRYEYPPATLPFVSAAWWVGGWHSPLAYVVAWMALMLVLDAAVVALLLRWGPRGTRAAGTWTAGVALFGPTAWMRNDLIVVAAVVLAWRLTLTRRAAASGLVWGFAALAKVWPATLLGALTLAWRPGRWRRAAAAAALFAGVLAALSLVGAAAAMISSLHSSQGGRPVEIESSWATGAWWYGLLSGRPLTVGYSYGSYNLAGPGFGHLAAAGQAATWLVQAASVLAPWAVARRTGRPVTAAAMAWWLLAGVAATLLVDPVLSPQYLLWLLGAVCLVRVLDPGLAARRAAQATVLGCAVSVLVYPLLFDPLRAGRPDAVAVLTLRNVLLVVVAGWCVAGLRRALRAPAGGDSAGGDSAGGGSADVVEGERGAGDRRQVLALRGPVPPTGQHAPAAPDGGAEPEQDRERGDR